MNEQELFLNKSQALEEQIDFLRQTIDLGIEFKNQAEVRTAPWNCPEYIEFPDIPDQGIPKEALFEEYRQIARKSTNFSSPNFLGFPDAGNSIASLSASVLIPFLNQNLINQDFCAPEATFIEMETIHWLRQLVGYQPAERYSQATDIGGCSVHGGVLANCTALLAAREALFPGSLRNGLKIDPARIKTIIPAGISHYSIRMSLAWLGLGESSTLEVPIDENHRMDLAKLEETIIRQRKSGNEILACVVYAGDSRTMAIDNLQEVAKVLRKYRIWLHVDACHGVQMLFSNKYRDRIAGIELANSITIDPHKVLWVPYVCSFVLFRDQNALRAVTSSSDLITKEKWSLGQTTPFIGSKAFNSFKLWSVIKHLGRNRIGELIDERIELRMKTQELIRNTPDLVLLNDTDINSSMFMYVPDALQKGQMGYGALNVLNEINLRIKNTIKENGKFYVHGFPIASSSFSKIFPPNATLQVLRIMNGNPNSSLEHIQNLLKEITTNGEKLCAERMGVLQPEKDLRETPLFREFYQWLTQFLNGVEHLAIVYGSSIYHNDLFSSDIDLMVIAEDSFCTQENREILQQKIIELHRTFSLPLDEEIPFERKLLVPLSFARASLVGGGFELRQHKVFIPDIVKTREFLSSRKMLARLITNILSTKNVLLSGAFDIYYELKIQSVRLVLWILMKHVTTVRTPDELCDHLYEFKGRAGEDFLGYKKSAALDEHLRPLVRNVFSEMLKKQEIIEFNGDYMLHQAYDLGQIRALQQLLATGDFE